jgi:hypothetical protein
VNEAPISEYRLLKMTNLRDVDSGKPGHSAVTFKYLVSASAAMKKGSPYHYLQSFTPRKVVAPSVARVASIDDGAVW